MNKDCSIQNVIVTSLELRGDGTTTAPMRRVTQVYTPDGKLIAERDPAIEEFLREIKANTSVIGHAELHAKFLKLAMHIH